MFGGDFSDWELGDVFCDAQFGAYFLVILRLFLFLLLVFEAFLLGISFFVRLGLFLGRRSG